MKIEEIFGKSINSVKELKEEIKRLQDSLINIEKGTDSWNETTSKLVSAQELLTSVTKAGREEVEASADSIVGLEKQYKNLYNQYKLLTEEERNSPFGKEMANSLNDLSNKLNETKKNVGNFKDNIGRYSESAIDAFGKMGISVGGIVAPIGQAKNAFSMLNKTMLANPVFWLIGALKLLQVAYGAIKNAIAGNEESQMRLNEAMSKFQPIVDAVKNALDALGVMVVDFISWIAEMYEKWSLFVASVTDFIGITEDETEAVRKQQQEYTNLAKRKNELINLKRENKILNAKDESVLEALKVEAAETENLTEKKKKLIEAKELEEKITARKINEKQEELDLLKIESTFTANDAEMNQRLADAEAELYRVQAEGARKTKEMATQITTLNKQITKEAEETKKLKSEQSKLIEEISTLEKLEEKDEKQTLRLIQAKKELAEVNKKLSKEIDISGYVGELDKVGDILTTVYQNSKSEIEILREKYEEEYQLLLKYNQDTTLLTEQYNQKHKELLEKQTQDELNEIEKRRINDLREITEHHRKQMQDKDIDSMFKRAMVNDTEDYEGHEAVNKTGQYNQYVFDKEQEMIDLRQQQIMDLLNLEKLTYDERYALIQEFYDNVEYLRQMNLEKERKERETLYESKMNMANSILNVADAVGQLSSAIGDNIERELQSGKITKEQAEKKKKVLKNLQAVQLAVSLATIAGDTAMGITSLWTAFAKKKVANAQLINPIAIATANGIDLASTIAQTVGLATMGASQMAGAIGGYISQVSSIGGSDSTETTPTASIPQSIDSTSYTYTRQLQTEEEKEESKAPIVVYVDDVKRALDNRDKVTVETTF